MEIFPAEVKLGKFMIESIPSLKSKLGGELFRVNMKTLILLSKEGIHLTIQQAETIMYFICFLHDKNVVERMRAQWRKRISYRVTNSIAKHAINRFKASNNRPRRSGYKRISTRVTINPLSRRRSRDDELTSLPSIGGRIRVTDDEREKFEKMPLKSSSDFKEFVKILLLAFAFPASATKSSPTYLYQEPINDKVEVWLENYYSAFRKFAPNEAFTNEDTTLAWFTVFMRQKPEKIQMTNLRFAGMKFITGKGDVEPSNCLSLYRRMRFLHDIYGIGYMMNFQAPWDDSDGKSHSNMIMREEEVWKTICSKPELSPTASRPCVFKSIPVEDWTAPTVDALTKWLETVTTSDVGECTGGHCTAGQGRTGTFILTGMKLAYPKTRSFTKLKNLVGQYYTKASAKELKEIYDTVKEDEENAEDEHEGWLDFAKFIDNNNRSLLEAKTRTLWSFGPRMETIAKEEDELRRLRADFMANPRIRAGIILGAISYFGKPNLEALNATVQAAYPFINDEIFDNMIQEAIQKKFIEQPPKSSGILKSVVRWLRSGDGRNYTIQITPKGLEEIGRIENEMKEEPSFKDHHRLNPFKTTKKKKGRRRSRSIGSSRKSVDSLTSTSFKSYDPSMKKETRRKVLKSILKKKSKSELNKSLRALESKHRVNNASLSRQVHYDRVWLKKV